MHLIYKSTDHKTFKTYEQARKKEDSMIIPMEVSREEVDAVTNILNPDRNSWDRG